ncbi:glycoside hydrolase family 3 N-terminal domain-containing protein [Cyclobacterium sp. 1_MG-2023]|uniref:glycoside hydrolase family 3 N-terminal domain-containing protein n=1 Tax=Cyclobacterium sp. 1_MG-2023 TaxID=3062681 RepID=UPI0026E41E8A|nr:glycoside hydrolase family 3 N-terminal domain-containing protein [Cyclobacterium sp. 1_MG-2023]MDO6438520.1 glycoside hydrolase family 3 N-terminal domain-containing protein [Cyclobacterium sp. 1_MG-2023]
MQQNWYLSSEIDLFESMTDYIKRTRNALSRRNLKHALLDLAKKGLLTLILLALNFVSLFAQQQPPFLAEKYDQWADSVLSTLTPEERIAQLIMIPAYSNKDKVHVDSIAGLVEKYGVGGIIFFQGGPVRQAHMINQFQALSKVPLMISLDGEWGLKMRLDSTVRYPYQMTLGGIDDESLLYEMGAEVARQAKRSGINVNFAPVVDVNNNANNPVIGFRSFGEEKENVTSKSLAYMKGMQDNGLLASAKHFPGHGDTEVDSHYGLPVLNFSKKRLKELELYPFQELMDEGLGSVMVAHMEIPVLDSAKNSPSSLSKPIVTDLLKNEMAYKGLIFTDALNMQAVAKYYPPGKVDAKALLAGNDMLLNTMNVPAAIEEIKAALERGEISQEEIDRRVRKVLKAKAWLGLDNWQPVETGQLIADLNNSSANYLAEKLTKASLTLLRNEAHVLPIKGLENTSIATLSIGTDQRTEFQNYLERYSPMDHFVFPKDGGINDINAIKESVSGHQLILVGIHGLGIRAGNNNFGISPEMVTLLRTLIDSHTVIVSIFGNVYSLGEIQGLENAAGVIAAYQETSLTQDLTAQMIFGGIGASGKLPVTINSSFKRGDGLQLEGGIRMAYTLPEGVGLASEDLSGIDSLMQMAIKLKAIPGGQVLVAKAGKVFYHKAFGYHTYDSLQEVRLDDLYDLASVTKISTSLAAFMHLKGLGKFDENQTLGHYLSAARGTNKEDLIYKDILTHQARLRSWIPFWMSTVKKNGKFKWFTMKKDSSKRFPIKVADSLYIHRNYSGKIYKKIFSSPLNAEPGYVYSDLSFILAPKVVEEITGEEFYTYLNKNLYKPIGAGTLTFNPYLNFEMDRIVPTEFDSAFRKQLLHGMVHDEGAAMLGGVSGHAGLFGTSNDLAKLMHLYLYDGLYAEEQLIASGVVHEYSKCVFCEEGNYRGMGFDRPNKPGDPNGNAAPSVSDNSFGHSGFTGTYSWIDPVNEIVYVFLSNRVHPSRENRNIYRLNVRTNILEEVYKAMGKIEVK